MPVYKLEKRGSDKCFAQCHLANGGQSGARIYLSSFAQHFVQDSLLEGKGKKWNLCLYAVFIPSFCVCAVIHILIQYIRI